MSLYEGIGGIAEKVIVVFDIGAAYTKFGFAGEFSPRCIVPSEIKSDSSGVVRKLYDYKNKQELYDMLVDFLHMLYFKYALISPKDRPVIVVESLLCPTLFRETLARVLFCHFEVGNVVWLPSHLVCLSTLAIDVGLVLDVGYSEAVLIPVCHGLPALNAWQALSLGSQAVHNSIKNLLKVDNYDVDLPDHIIEDIKVRTCFITNLERSQQHASGKLTEYPPNVEYPNAGARNILISGKLRETAFEVLFEQDNDFQSISTMILDAILQCPVDLRKPLAENIVIIGGTSMILGFKERLRQELYYHLQSNRYKERILLNKFKFHVAPAKENYTAWLGGAIYGCTEMPFMHCLTKETYLRDKRVPDWANMLDNKAKNINFG